MPSQKQSSRSEGIRKASPSRCYIYAILLRVIPRDEGDQLHHKFDPIAVQPSEPVGAEEAMNMLKTVEDRRQVVRSFEVRTPKMIE